MAKRVAERAATEHADVEDGELDSIPALEVVASTGAGSGGAVRLAPPSAFDQQRLDYWRKALAKVDELADQPLASADVLVTPGLGLPGAISSFFRFLVLIRWCVCVCVCACVLRTFFVSCMDWPPLPRDSSPMVWWLGISARL